MAFAHCFPPRCADLGYILYTKPLILEEVKRDVLFYGQDPGSVGNGTAVSSPLTGAIMSPGSKQPFPSFFPEGLAPTGGTRTWKPGQPETLLFVSSTYSSDSFSSSLREGVPRETRGGDTPPAFSLMAIGTGGGRGRRPPRYRTEPVRGTRLRDVHGDKVPLGTSVGTLNKLIDK